MASEPWACSQCGTDIGDEPAQTLPAPWCLRCTDAVQREVEKLRAERRLLLLVYEAAWKDECKPTYCALQRGGLIHQPLLDAYEVLGEPDDAKGGE